MVAGFPSGLRAGIQDSGWPSFLRRGHRGRVPFQWWRLPKLLPWWPGERQLPVQRQMGRLWHRSLWFCLTSVIRLVLVLQPSSHLEPVSGERARSQALLGDCHQYFPLWPSSSSPWFGKLFFYSSSLLRTFLSKLKSSLSITLNANYLPRLRHSC